jgi:pyruvate/2-oxoglutarate dehydrogenase complex dihydrolipoamide dehydrogenase (E3) component
MKYDYDVIVIGLGPAGMAVAAMGSEMGLAVCAIEQRSIGGECMNVGCIPSKALLRAGKVRHTVGRTAKLALEPMPLPGVSDHLFQQINNDIHYINEHKTAGMFKKVDLHLGEGHARFVDDHTVAVGDQQLSAKRIYICTGTRPAVPPIPGIDTVDVLTNENLFHQDKLPASLTIIGGGAIGCEMAQAFSRLGCPTTIVHMDEHLLPFGDREAGELLEKVFREEGIGVYNGRKIDRVANEADGVALYTDKGERVVGARLLVAAGRRLDFSTMDLEKAGIAYGKRGIEVNRYLQTSRPHIYAAGDCNGQYLLSHAAMHQGMIALMNSMLIGPFRMDFRKFVVPWTVFTEPQVSQVGQTEAELQKQGVKYEVVRSRYEDYGAAIAEKIDIGHVKAFVSPTGRIFGTQVIGEGSGEMINEWGLAIQKKIPIYDIMMLQHAFPSMSFLSKRAADAWMMKRMKFGWVRNLIRWLF